MQRFFYLVILTPNLLLANFCPQTAPLMEHYQSQKHWRPYVIKEDGIQNKLSGFLDDMNNFFPEEAFKRSKESVLVTADPANEDSEVFYQFCKKYEDRGPLLTTFRVAQAMNRHTIKVKYLPSMKDFNNDPFSDMSTLGFKLILDIDKDSLVGRLPRFKYLKEQIEKDLNSQLSESTPIGEYHLTLTNWDDFACDMIHGKARLSIVREIYSNKMFVNMEEIIRPVDLNYLYEEWSSQLRQVKKQDELMFNAGVIYAAVQEQGLIAKVLPETAFKLIKSVTTPGKKGLDALGEVQLACLSDSLQNYEADYTQYKFNVIFDVDTEMSLNQGE